MPYRLDDSSDRLDDSSANRPHGLPDFITSFKNDVPLWILRIHTMGALVEELRTFYNALFGDLGIEKEIGGAPSNLPSHLPSHLPSRLPSTVTPTASPTVTPAVTRAVLLSHLVRGELVLAGLHLQLVLSMIARGLLSIRRLRIYLRYSIVDIIARVMALISLILAESYGEEDYDMVRTVCHSCNV